MAIESTEPAAIDSMARNVEEAGGDEIIDNRWLPGGGLTKYGPNPATEHASHLTGQLCVQFRERGLTRFAKVCLAAQKLFGRREIWNRLPQRFELKDSVANFGRLRRENYAKEDRGGGKLQR